MNIDDIYTPIDEAKKEIQRRWNNPILRKKAEDFFEGNLPEVFKNEPRAILARGILTPNFETRYFLDLMDLIELKPVCGEFHDDKFCTMNKDKIHLGKLVFLRKSNKTNNDVIDKKTIIDLEKYENKPFKEIKTLYNKSLVDFHHHLYNKEYKEIMNFFDISIFKKKGETAKEVYEKIFTLCIASGVLFENFIAKEREHEKKFTEEVVLPAFKSVCDKFNLKPLIIPLLPLKNEEREIWDWYPGHLEKEVDGFLTNN